MVYKRPEYFEKFDKFVNDTTKKLSGLKRQPADFSAIFAYPAIPGHAIYIFDFQKGDVVFARGIELLLGYPDDKFDCKLLLEVVHPADGERLFQLITFANDYIRNNRLGAYEVSFSLSFRLRKNDNQYIKVLRQSSVCEVAEDGTFISNFTILSDISYLNTGTMVDYSITGPHNERVSMEDYIKGRHAVLFSVREKEILMLLSEGKNSQQIANQLFISKHTVNTHRRNMLEKSSCSNTRELLYFGYKNGLLKAPAVS